MLYAIDWIRQQLDTGYLAVVRFLEELTIDSINDFLTQNPIMIVLFDLAALALILIGFRSHKLLSGIFGAVLMGFWGWQIAESTNTSFLTTYILLTLIFSIIGFFTLYFLFVISAGLGIFCLSFALLRNLVPTGILMPVILAGAIAIIYCILLIGKHTIRTPIEGGALLALIAWSFLGPVLTLLLFVASVAVGIILQTHLKKIDDEKRRIARNFRPNAPTPPTREEIEAERAEEEAKRALRQKSIEQAYESPDSYSNTDINIYNKGLDK